MKKIFTSPLAWASLAFVVSRIVYRMLGIQFDSSPLLWFWQILDPYLLTNHLTSSLLYLHTQPPLFNLLLGLFFKLFPGSLNVAFSVFYLGLGLVLFWSLYQIMTSLGVNDKIAALLTILFSVSPACVLYENWLFYTYLMALFLMLSLLFLRRFVSGQGFWPCFLFFLSLALCVLTRTSFHLIWFLVLLLLVLRLQRLHAKRILLASAFPLLLLIFLYAKNLYLFGEYPGSTWLGMSLFKIVSSEVSLEDRQRLFAESRISEISLFPSYSWLTTYPLAMRRTAPTGIPALDQKAKTTGFNNYNHIAYSEISRYYLRDSLFLIRWSPSLYWRAVRESFRIYAFSASELVFLRSNREKIPWFDAVANRILFGNFSGKPEGPYWFLLLGIPALCVYSIAKTSALFKQGNVAAAVPLVFLSFNVFYASIIGNLLEIGENHRYRFEIDGFLVILSGLALTDLYRAVRHRYF